MPGRARLMVPGVPLRLIQRGDNRQACFYGDRDYRFYLDGLGACAADHACRIHAQVLMTNHGHLLVSADTADGAEG